MAGIRKPGHHHGDAVCGRFANVGSDFNAAFSNAATYANGRACHGFTDLRRSISYGVRAHSYRRSANPRTNKYSGSDVDVSIPGIDTGP